MISPYNLELYRAHLLAACGIVCCSIASAAGEVKVTDNVMDEGQTSFRIETPAATWFYHKKGAGFSSLLDPEGKDWISYQPGGGAAGEYRGIPNLGPCCHPGYDGADKGSTSLMVSTSPGKAVIESVSRNGKIRLRWEFLPDRATLVIEKAEANYYVLYEGTPYGKLDRDRDFQLLPDGRRLLVRQSWSKDLSPEWILFGDAATKRGILAVHHEDDAIVDQFWEMGGNMTVFGFGRTCSGACQGMRAAPQRFTFGLVSDTTYAYVSKTAEAWIKQSPSAVFDPERAGYGHSSNCVEGSALDSRDALGRSEYPVRPWWRWFSR